MAITQIVPKIIRWCRDMCVCVCACVYILYVCVMCVIVLRKIYIYIIYNSIYALKKILTKIVTHSLVEVFFWYLLRLKIDFLRIDSLRNFFMALKH
jgi:hypothetical protein